MKGIKMQEIYLDNSATTRAFPEVAELMTKVMTEDYGNPSSMHHLGVVAEGHLREASKYLLYFRRYGIR